LDLNKNKPLFSENELNKAIIKISVKPEGKKNMEWNIFWNNFANKKQ
jgi:hypothetical protein